MCFCFVARCTVKFRLVRFHLFLDYIKLALFLFRFLTISAVAFVVGHECQIITLVVIKGAIFCIVTYIVTFIAVL